ncbi:hypothetical protein ZOSMA_111G00250 [Zostera marina]|uniref:AB hydrolase-1 domain-containing protein n=1 Tax=Zostera marina TaxID=29655 RepID=A0A0K9Q3D3_ZOSMR|nr:hypothetical protein ZOSMA_111G00250 [Zostera marina]
MMIQFAATTTDVFRRVSSILPMGWVRTTNTNSRKLLFHRIPVRSSFSSLRASSSPASSESEPAESGSNSSKIELNKEKEEVCTADELHYVDVPGTEWKIALWRYIPCPKAPPRNHPLLLLPGLGTNANGFDLSPEISFARNMSNQGFDTWIVEVRGSGLSSRINSVSTEQISSKLMDEDFEDDILSKLKETDSRLQVSEEVSTVNETEGEEVALASFDKLQFTTMLNDTLFLLTKTVSDYMSESQLQTVTSKFMGRISKVFEEAGLSDRFNEIQEMFSTLLEKRQDSVASKQIRDLSQQFVNLLDEGQKSVSPQLSDLQERLSDTIKDFQKQLDTIQIYDWDFDHYLEEDVPIAIEFIKAHTHPKDGKLLAIGHSMGGILLYSMLSRCGVERKQSDFAAVATLASSLDYKSSNSSLKLMLPLADPAQALNVPVVPFGAIMAAAYPLTSEPPYFFSWITTQVSAPDMMHPEHFKKLVLTNFCTVPAKLVFQLTTAFEEGGLRNRTGTFYYKDHIDNCDVPVLALAGDQDLICPPEAVYETAQLFPQDVVTYKVFGKPDGPHYGHYDLVGGRWAVDEVYPFIVDFLSQHDEISESL